MSGNVERNIRGLSMDYRLYKLSFTTPVHFGTGVLNESAIGFCADTLFSALFIEALKLSLAEQLYSAVNMGKLRFSDAFPYIEKQYFLPKPMTYIEPKNRGNSVIKKQYKKLKYIPVTEFTNFLTGDMDPEICSLQGLGRECSQVMAAVRREEEDALPYRVGNYLFNENSGLYVIAAMENNETKVLLEELFDSLSYSGIGGKRGSGKGRFVLKQGMLNESFQTMLGKKSDRYMLIASALPKEDEMEAALEGASYQVLKRSGFVCSASFAEEETKKRDLYTLQAGSCFTKAFDGDVYDVSEGGNHPVYRYAKGMFLGV